MRARPGNVRIPVIAATVAVAVVTAGCGAAAGGSDSGGGSGGKTVKIGMSSILSGPAASAGVGTDAGLRAYLESRNAEGGINGYTFTYDEQDNEYDPAKAATVARNLVNNDVFLMLTEGTAPYAATAPIAAAADIPLFTESDGKLLTPPPRPSEFGVNPVYERVAAQGAQFIAESLKEKQAGLVYLNTATGAPARDSFGPAFEALGGQVVDTESIEQKTTDYAPFAQKLKQSGAPVVYAFVLDTQLPGLQKAAAAIGYRPKWVTWATPYTPSYLDLAGDLAAGTYVSLFVTPLDQDQDPAVQEYRTAMQKYAPDQLESQTAQQGWTFGAIIAKGVEAATSGGKELTPEAFTAALGNIDAQPLGLIPSITYDDQSHAGATGAAYYQINPDGSLTQETPYAELPASP